MLGEKPQACSIKTDYRMIRGFKTFKCDSCHKTFKGLDIEWMATAYSQPVKCPYCGSTHTYPPGLFDLSKGIYKKIWKIIDNKCNK